MKVLIRSFATLILLCITGMATAQDVIVMKDQSTIMSKVLEITSTEIKYKKWNNQDGPTYFIDRSEVTSINYENGEVENFSETTDNQQNKKLPQLNYPDSYMTFNGASLYLNGRLLSDKEVQSLVSPEDYQLYLKAGNQSLAGFLLEVGGGLSGAVALAIRLFSKDFEVSGPSVLSTTGFKTYITFAAIAVTTFGSGIIINVFGRDNIKKVADTYNKNHDNFYSLNISPSLMKFEIPQLQGNCGLGLTLSMNF